MMYSQQKKVPAMNTTGDCDVTENPLDVEYRNILFIIKPYILQANNPYHLEKYKIWLERLSESSSVEKFERNKYLVELANQIHDGALQPPFTSSPPRGPLPRLRKYQEKLNKSVQLEWPYIPQPEKPPRQKEPIKKKIVKYKTRPKVLSKVAETSSWYDLSESVTTVNTHACGDTETEADDQKDIDLEHTEEGLKLKEHYLQKYEEEMGCQQDDENSPRSDTTQKEVEALKMRMKDLMEVKNALRDTHCLTEDRKKIIENLQVKLVAVEQENAELKVMIQKQAKKIEELEAHKNKEFNDFKEKFTNLRNKELEILKIRHLEEIENLQKSCQEKINNGQKELLKQIEELKKQHQEQIEQLLVSHGAILKEKEGEISRIQNQMKLREETCLPIEENMEIMHLKKCISRLDKLLNKNEKDYVKKVEKLKQELEIKEMTSQVQMQTQRADLMVRNSVAKQEELRYALNSLETKYKKMIENLQTQAIEAKKHDEQVIGELKSLLQKHSIVYT